MTYNELCESILMAQEEMLKYGIEANSVTLNGRKYGKLIENCPPNMKPTIFGMAVKADYALPDAYDFLVQHEPPQPHTNADRIRSMTDEELAYMLVDIGECDRRCPAKLDDCIFSDSSCRSAWLDWLKSPVNLEAGK